MVSPARAREVGRAGPRGVRVLGDHDPRGETLHDPLPTTARPRRLRGSPDRGGDRNSITKLPPRQVNDVWTHDFISIRLADGSKLRMLSVLDEYSRFAMPR
jgi:hypothetical protein